MPKRYSSKQISKFLRSSGFTIVSQKGSHLKFKNDTGRITILPNGRKILPPGTLNGILEKAGISKLDLNKFFKK